MSSFKGIFRILGSPRDPSRFGPPERGQSAPRLGSLSVPQKELAFTFPGRAGAENTIPYLYLLFCIAMLLYSRSRQRQRGRVPACGTASARTFLGVRRPRPAPAEAAVDPGNPSKAAARNAFCFYGDLVPRIPSLRRKRSAQCLDAYQ